MPDNRGQIGSSLELDTRGFFKGLEDAQKKAESAVGGIQSAFAKLAGGGLAGGVGGLFGNLGALGGLAGGGAAFGTLGLLGAGITTVVSKFNELGQAGVNAISQQIALASRFQLTASAAGALQIAAERYGVSQEEINSGLSHMYRLLNEVRQGSASAGRAFRQLGLDAGSLANDPESALNQVMGALAGQGAVTREALAREIFGRGGIGMGNMARRLGPGGLQRTQEEGLASGAIASDEQVEGFREAKQVGNQLKAAQAEASRAMENAWARPLQSMSNDLSRLKLAGTRLLGAVAGNNFEGGLFDLPAHAAAAGGGAGGPAAPQAAMEAFDQLKHRLDEQIATQGMAREAMDRFRLAQLGATDAMLGQIRELQNRNAVGSVSASFAEVHGFNRERTRALRASATDPFALGREATEEEVAKRVKGVEDTSFRANWLRRTIASQEGRLGDRSRFARGQAGEREMVQQRSYMNTLKAELETLNGLARSGARNALRDDMRQQENDAILHARAQMELGTRTGPEQLRDRARQIQAITQERVGLGGVRGFGADLGLASRGYLGLLGEAEGRFGLNQPIRQAQLSTRGSAAAIAAINTAQLQSSQSGQTVQDRIAAVNQAALEVQRSQLEQQRQMTDLLRSNGGRNPLLDNLN